MGGKQGTFEEVLHESLHAAGEEYERGANRVHLEIDGDRRMIDVVADYRDEPVHHGRPSHVYQFVGGMMYCVTHHGLCQETGVNH